MGSLAGEDEVLKEKIESLAGVNDFIESVPLQKTALLPKSLETKTKDLIDKKEEQEEVETLLRESSMMDDEGIRPGHWPLGFKIP